MRSHVQDEKNQFHGALRIVGTGDGAGIGDGAGGWLVTKDSINSYLLFIYSPFLIWILALLQYENNSSQYFN